MSDYKKDFFRNKVFGSVEKLSGAGGNGDRQFGSNDDDEEKEDGDEAAEGKIFISVYQGREVLLYVVRNQLEVKINKAKVLENFTALVFIGQEPRALLRRISFHSCRTLLLPSRNFQLLTGLGPI